MQVEREVALRAGLLATGLVAGLGGAAAAQDSKNITLLSIPSATVPAQGIGYFALSGTPNSPMNDRTDGSAELGFGLGSAEESVGFQGRIVITSLTDDFGDAGYLGFKLSRRVSAGPVPLYLGLDVTDLAGWGASSGLEPSVSVIATGFALVQTGGSPMPVMFTVGAGNRLRDDDTEPALFAGIGAGFNEYLGGSVAWTGETLDLGLSLRPAADSPFVLNVTLGDVTDRLGEQRVSVTAAWVFGKGLGG